MCCGSCFQIGCVAFLIWCRKFGVLPSFGITTLSVLSRAIWADWGKGWVRPAKQVQTRAPTRCIGRQPVSAHCARSPSLGWHCLIPFRVCPQSARNCPHHCCSTNGRAPSLEGCLWRYRGCRMRVDKLCYQGTSMSFLSRVLTYAYLAVALLPHPPPFHVRWHCHPTLPPIAFSVRLSWTPQAWAPEIDPSHHSFGTNKRNSEVICPYSGKSRQPLARKDAVGDVSRFHTSPLTGVYLFLFVWTSGKVKSKCATLRVWHPFLMPRLLEAHSALHTCCLIFPF